MLVIYMYIYYAVGMYVQLNFIMNARQRFAMKSGAQRGNEIKSYLGEMILPLQGRNFVNLHVAAFQTVARVHIFVCFASFFLQLSGHNANKRFSNEDDLPLDDVFSVGENFFGLFLTVMQRQTSR